MKHSLIKFLGLSFLLIVAAGCSSGGRDRPPAPTPNPELVPTVQDWIASHTDTPYKDVALKVVSQDDVFATIEVHAQLRASEQEDWHANIATYKLKKVGGKWKVDEASTFEKSGDPRLQATALARLSSDGYFGDVVMTSQDEGWAVGAVAPVDVIATATAIASTSAPTPGSYNWEFYAVMSHSTNGKWEAIPDPELLDYQSVGSLNMVSQNEGWAIGTNRANHYAILHYANGGWDTALQQTDAKKQIYALHMLSKDEGWAVGYDETSSAGLFIHYKAGKWEEVKTSIPDVMVDVFTVSAGDVWAVSDKFWHYKDGNWTSLTSPSSGQPLISKIYMLSTTDGWAFTSTFTSTYGGKQEEILHFSKGEWVVFSTSSDWLLSDLAMTSPGEGWAVGGNGKGKGLVLHFKAGKWDEVESHSNNPLTALAMVSPTEGWAVGNHGTLLHYKDGAWTVYKP